MHVVSALDAATDAEWYNRLQYTMGRLSGTGAHCPGSQGVQLMWVGFFYLLLLLLLFVFISDIIYQVCQLYDTVPR